MFFLTSPNLSTFSTLPIYLSIYIYIHSSLYYSVYYSALLSTVIKTESPTEANEHLPFSASAVESQEKHNQQMHKLELHRRARQIVVPTNDEFVKAKLREIGQPIILFGEKVLFHSFPSAPLPSPPFPSSFLSFLRFPSVVLF